MQHFPSWAVTAETYLLACLLHDIGTTEKNLLATQLSFEIFGGMLALDLLHRQHNAPLVQAEGVAEAIIRHQDLETTTGNITTLGLLLQIGTLLGAFFLLPNSSFLPIPNDSLLFPHPPPLQTITSTFFFNAVANS
jgi:cyanamide hydratase